MRRQLSVADSAGEGKYESNVRREHRRQRVDPTPNRFDDGPCIQHWKHDDRILNGHWD
jgi:hypothetical protein